MSEADTGAQPLLQTVSGSVLGPDKTRRWWTRQLLYHQRQKYLEATLEYIIDVYIKVNSVY